MSSMERQQVAAAGLFPTAWLHPPTQWPPQHQVRMTYSCLLTPTFRCRYTPTCRCHHIPTQQCSLTVGGPPELTTTSRLHDQQRRLGTPSSCHGSPPS
eukprot:1391293-Amphidinium_carterae.1